MTGLTGQVFGPVVLALAFMVALSLCGAAMAQESPTPASIPEQSASSSPTPTTPTPTPTPVRQVRIQFVPPPMEGTISLGIFDEQGKLVRVLHREAKIENFTVEENSLSTSWDGKNDAGEDAPAGKYRARGYAVGDLKSHDIGKSKEPVFNDAPETVSITLIANPLTNGTRSVVNLMAGFNERNAYLKTADGLPLRTIAQTEEIMDGVTLLKDSNKSLQFYFRHGEITHEFRITGAEEMMAFDCGTFDLK
ncbi:MAG: hypothetical protein ACREIW_02615 [Chthoniobacterales bacterium]